MEDCIFCKIVNKEIPADNIIYEDEDSLGLLDVHPIAPGHSLVVSKVHAENILGLPDDKIGGVFTAVKRVSEMLNKSLRPDGFTYGVNDRIGQTIGHLHILIIPRYKGDGGTSVHQVVSNPPKESLEEIKEKIVKNGN
ncbi:MAG: HIT family protein [Candidatus Jorgensenbacteria bacterium]